MGRMEARERRRRGSEEKEREREREEEVKLKLVVCVEVVDGVEEKTVGRNASLLSKGDGERDGHT